MIGFWVAVVVAVGAFIVGRLWGRREGVIKHFAEEIIGEVRDIEMIAKYHCESLPLVAKELMDDYTNNRKFHEDDAVEMMRAVAFHYSRIQDNLFYYGMKSPNKAKTLEKSIVEWIPSIVSKTEEAEAAFVQQIRMAADPKFRENLSTVNQEGFDRFLQSYGYLETYWQHTPKYRQEMPGG